MKVVVTLTKEFFKGHRRAGQPTNFASSVKDGRKIHTCRDNYGYWAGKVAALKEAGGTLCIREWTGRPYRSPQGTIKEVPADLVEVSRLEFTRYQHRIFPYKHSITCYKATVDGRPVEVLELAKNDGFTTPQDFTQFLEPLFETHGTDTLTLAIIHFTPYRYGSKETNQRR